MFQKKFSDESSKRGFNAKRGFAFLIFGLLFILVIPFIVMGLWNSVVPEVTRFSSINYKQALFLFILSRLLFGGFRFGNSGQRPFGGRGPEWKKKWQNMSDEERIQLKEAWKKRCEERKTNS